MSRFDDELRRAARPLADEPLPPDILDEALDAPPDRPRWSMVAAAATGVLLLAVAVGIGLGGLAPDPTGSPEPSPTVEPTVVPAPAACEALAQPAGGGDVIQVFFPCGSPAPGDPASSVRSVAAGTAAVERLGTALRHVLEGPSELERQAGRDPVVPAGSADLLEGVVLTDDGLAHVDFAPELRAVNNLSASAAAGAFLASLRETAFQFDEVTAIELRIDGSCHAFFELLQSSCEHIAKPVPSFDDCPVIPPAELPSGAPITEARPHPTEEAVAWGSGRDTVIQWPGLNAWNAEPRSDSETLIRGHPALVGPISQGPEADIELVWREGGCLRTIAFSVDRLDAVEDYAARYGPSMAQAPREVSERSELPSCGTETVERRAEGDYYDARVRECFLAAYARGEPAELISVGLTVEGGTVTEILRHLPDGRIETFTDWTQDPLATPGWTRQVCRQLEEIYTDPDGVPVFIGADCDDPEYLLP